MAILRRPATQCTRKKLCISKECRDCKDGLGSNECFVPSVKTRGVLPKPEKPKKAMEPMSPQQFHELDVSKKIHWLSMAYMNRCDERGFTTKGLFALRGYFKKVDVSKLQCFFDYISSLKEPTVVSLYDLYAKSESYQLQLRLNANKADVEVEEYPSLLSFIDRL